LHETFPPPVSSDTLSLGRLAYETSNLIASRTADLVYQPSHWGAELPRAIGLNTGGCKASLISYFLPTFKPPTSSSYLNDNGMELGYSVRPVLPSAPLSSLVMYSTKGPSSQLSDTILAERQRHHPYKVFCQSIKENRVIKAKE